MNSDGQQRPTALEFSECVNNNSTTTGAEKCEKIDNVDDHDDDRNERINNKTKPGGRGGLTPALLFTVLAVAFGINFGIYNSSVVNNLKPSVVRYINETTPVQWLSFSSADSIRTNYNPNILWSIVVSAFTAGSAVGTLASPFLAEQVGRRGGLLTSASLNAAGSVLCFLYLYVFELALFGRLLMGFSLGLGIPIASAFITEISPVSNRGQLNALLQTAFGLGDLCGMVFSVEQLLGDLPWSPYALSFTVVFSVIQFAVMFFAHESPRFLILKRNRLQEGKKAILYYQGEVNVCEIAEEIQSENKIHIDDTLVNVKSGTNDQNFDSSSDSPPPQQQQQEKNFTGDPDIRVVVLVENSSSSVWSHLTKKPLLLSCLLLTTTALTGISPVMAFSTDAFMDNGVPRFAQFCTVALGLSNFIGSFVAVGLMETWGRKPLLITGVVGCFCSITCYTATSLILSHHHEADANWSYILVACLISFLLFFSLCGAANNTLAAEICPQNYRSTAVSLANFCLMFFSTVLILLYEIFKELFGYSWVYFPASAISMLIGLYLIISVPETKDRTLTDLKKYFEP